MNNAAVISQLQNNMRRDKKYAENICNLRKIFTEVIFTGVNEIHSDHQLRHF